VRKINLYNIFFFVLFFSFSGSIVYAQTTSADIKSNNLKLKKSLNNDYKWGGKYLPSKGTIRALAVYIQFKEDDYQDDHWKLNQIPDWADEFSKEIKDYFTAMSMGNLNLEIESYPKVFIPYATELEYSYYSCGYGVVNREALTEVDRNISFLPYDNWKLNGNYYNYVSGQDGVIDLVIMIYRRVTIKKFLSFYGISDLGYSADLLVDNGKRTVWGGYPEDIHKDASGSGISVCYAPGTGMKMDLYTCNRLVRHEICHKFFGEGHFIYNFASLGENSNSNGGAGFHSYERAFLGYLDYFVIDSTVTEPFTLDDYMTTGEAAIIKIPNLDHKYYIIENRQKISPYDEAYRKGLYIYQGYFAGEYSSLDIQSADGKWNWDLKENSLVKNSANPINGKSHLELVSTATGDYYPPDMNGNDYDAFYPGYKTVYAPWTNPCSNGFQYGAQDYPTNISINILNMQDSKLTLKVSFQADLNSISELKPEKKIQLNQNYPNPFNPFTVISYQLSVISHITLKVYDLLGREVTTLIDEKKNPGNYEVNFSGRNLPSGVYYYTLKCGNYTETKKMIFQK
jgi:hypothetical protein